MRLDENAQALQQYTEEENLDFELARILQFGMAAFCSILTLVFYFFTYQRRDERVFRAASRTFLFIMLMGVQFSWISIVLNASLDYLADINVCYAIFTSESIGFAFVFGVLVAKSLRLVQFLKVPHAVPKISDFTLIKGLGIYVFVWLGICLLAISAPLSNPPSFVIYDQWVESGPAFMRQCDMGSLAHLKLFGQGFSVLVGIAVAFITSNIPAPFNEGVWISRCFYNYLGTTFAYGLYVFLDPRATLPYRLLGQVGNILGSQGVAILLMIVPKLFAKNDKSGGGNKTSSTNQGGKRSSQITIITPEPVYIESNPIPSTRVQRLDAVETVAS